MTADDTHATDAARFFADSLDETGRLIGGVHCIRCHYDLRGITPAGVCPECGVPILDKSRLRFASPVWLKRLRRGPALFFLALAAFVGSSALQTASVSLPMRVGERIRLNQTSSVVTQLVQFVCVALSLMAVLYLTARDPAQPVRSERLSPRRLARFLAFVVLVLSVISTLVVLIRQEASYSRAAGVLAVLIMAAWALLIFSLLHQTVRLMQRIPARWGARYARTVWWFSIPVLSLFIASMLAAALSPDAQVPRPPYAIVAGWSSPATAPAAAPIPTSRAVEYFIFDEEGFVTRVATVPDSIRVVDWSQSGLGFALSDALCTLGWWPGFAFIIAFIVLLIITRYQIGRALCASIEWQEGGAG